MRPFIFQKILASSIGSGRAWSKNLWQKPPKLDFWGPFLGIFNNISKPVTYVILCLTLRHWWKSCTNWTWFGLVIYLKPPKSRQKSYFLLVRQTSKIYITWQPQMLYQWNLPGLCISMRPFICPNIGASSIRRKRAWSKNFWKRTTKWGFSANFFEFSENKS